MSDYKTQQAQSAQWWQSVLGQWLLRQEKKALAELGGYFFGYFQCQLGAPESLLPADWRPSQKIVIGPDHDVEMQVEALALQNHSVDCVLLVHVLEFSADPHQILREVERVLLPDGHLVICCFNPWSLWGLRRLWSWQEHRPWRGAFYSAMRLKEWLSVLNFQVLEVRSLAFRPPSQIPAVLRGFRFLDRWGRRLWPWCGGVKILVATQRRIPLTPILARRPKLARFTKPSLANSSLSRDPNHG